METTALVMAYVGVALMVGLAGIASAIGTSIAGQAGSRRRHEKERRRIR